MGHVIEGRCEVRVWDNGDMTDCGRKILRGGVCAEHLQKEVAELRESIRKHERAIREALERLDALQTESG